MTNLASVVSLPLADEPDTAFVSITLEQASQRFESASNSAHAQVNPGLADVILDRCKRYSGQLRLNAFLFYYEEHKSACRMRGCDPEVILLEAAYELGLIDHPGRCSRRA